MGVRSYWPAVVLLRGNVGIHIICYIRLLLLLVVVVAVLLKINRRRWEMKRKIH